MEANPEVGYPRDAQDENRAARSGISFVCAGSGKNGCEVVGTGMG